MDQATNCLSVADMLAVLDGSAVGAERATWQAHIDTCPKCAAEFESTASQWSLGALAVAAARAAGPVTRGIRGRVADAAPDDTVAGRPGDTPLLPQSLPRIPGVVDLEPIGRGGMGVVYRGRDAALDRLVAVKVLPAWSLVSEAGRRRAEREALMLARLDHPNVVKVHAAGEAEGVPYLIMEWVSGPTLQQQLRTAAVPPREAARISLDLARALEQVHALGIIHRDIKPANILLAGGDQAASAVPKLVDFGLARPEEVTQQLTQAEDVLGTPGFMAPEQTGLDPGFGEAGPATDVHGVGGLLYAMLTGRPPFEAATPLETMQRAVRGEVDEGRLETVPADLRTILLKCLRPQPARRYRSAGELADDLARYLEGRPVLARPVSAAERVIKWMRRRPLAAAAAGLGLSLAVVGVAGISYHAVRLERANREITRSRDEAREAMDVAERSMERLTGESIKRMLFRGEALDEGDLEYLRQVRDEFAEWPLGSNPPQALWFRARGLKRAAGLFFDIARYDDALACQQGELAVLAALDRLSPGDEQVLRARLDAHYRMRYSLYHLRRPEEAIASSRESIALLEAAAPELPRRERDLIDTRYHLGVFLQDQGRFDEGAAIVTAALAALESLRRRQPDDISLVSQQLESLWGAQLYAYEGGRHAERRELLDRLVAGAERAMADAARQAATPTQLEGLIHHYTLGLAQLVNIARDSNQLDEAVDHAGRRLDVCREYLQTVPEATRIRAAAIDAALSLAGIHGRRLETAEAGAAIDEALLLAEQAVAAQPAVYDNAVLLGRSVFAKGQFLAAEGDEQAALPLFHRAITLMEPWLAHGARSPDAAQIIDSARRRIDELAGG